MSTRPFRRRVVTIREHLTAPEAVLGPGFRYSTIEERATTREMLLPLLFALANPTWWKRASAFERGLSVIAVCGVLLRSVSAGSIDLKFSNLKSCNGTGAEISDNICTSPACIHTASRILKAMDTSVDPCHDFYRFSCGGFLKSTTIPDGEDFVDTFTTIRDQVSQQLRETFEDPALAEMIHPFRLFRTLYKTCMNKSAIEEQGRTPLLSILKKLGNWPVLEKDMWKDNDFNWMSSVYNFREMGFSYSFFLHLYIYGDYKNSTKRVLNLDQASLGLSREFLSKGLEDENVKEYYRSMVDVAVMLGAERERAEQELMESLKFEMKLSNISLPAEKRRNTTFMYNPMTLIQLSAKYPSIPWKEYFNTILKPHTQVDDNEIIIVNVPSYISDFEQLIKSTPRRIQANYAMWRAVQASMSYVELSDDINRKQFEYSLPLSGQTETVSRWKTCVNHVSTALPTIAGALYIKKYFNEAKKNAVEKMVSDIQNQFINILQTIDWMDEETRKGALDKAASITSDIAYPDELLQDFRLEEFYKKLKLDENASYLKNILDLKLFFTEYSFSQLRKPVNKSDWVTHSDATVVNAFYEPRENSLIFPAAVLHDIVLSSDRPKYINYGAIGSVIGHEITHGFDDMGSQLDKYGNLVDWWSSSTKKKYLQKIDCIINQYGNNTVKEVGINLNGINTQGENIADNGGTKTAYLAYKHWADQNNPEPTLPGLSYSPIQMFWISNANIWCSIYRPEELKLWVSTDTHSPGDFRVLVPMSNIQEFANDFNCPLESRMNPQHKCTVW